MNNQEVYDFLTSRGIEYEVTEHGAVSIWRGVSC